MSDITEAFDHPEERSKSTAEDPRDRISLRDHVVEVDIGAFQPERGRSQRVRFNVVVEVGRHDAALTDDVDRILSYDTLTEAIRAELAAERLNLLETLAERIADRILTEPLAMRVFIRIEKLDRGPGALGVEIVRSASHLPRLAEEMARDSAPHPRIVFLSNAAIGSDNLPAWLDELGQGPAILCVGPAEVPPPQTGHAPTQRRIDLLAIEQNAWVLAARDPRCMVVSTRTELDWAMRNGQLTVWAPSKIVLDAVEAPPPGPVDALALTQWFAATMHAEELVLVGMHPPAGAPIATRVADPASPTLSDR
ncbi:dihydroneopterin aldolase [Tranquillimonas alkanivorans]|uniref:dihydroneopterin aldolase n=1 Tax=Tranquillimonas alkanivorans TaxID=441119 RepID=A0A1I5KJJ6_9RHOB|nr:dihydroneopterin aldolase [Tranquillimonas alkanivorans]SFO85250.1 dihydroneopterin aldolase [Tranquillimonas alkanivorans]